MPSSPKTRLGLSLLLGLLLFQPGTVESENGDPSLAISSDLRITILRGREITLEVRGSESESAESVARRVTRPGEIKAVRAWNAGREVGEETWWSIPLPLLSDDYRRVVLINLFPKDHADGADWIHIARSGALPIYDEGLWQVATWFHGKGEAFERLMQANGLSSPELRAEQHVRIPADLLHPGLRSGARSGNGLLEYGSDRKGPYAAYTLLQGEALYSAVIVRFTGRTEAQDVIDVAELLRTRNSIHDLRDMPVGFRVKIPLDLLEAGFLPTGHPRRLEAEAREAELARELKRQPAGGQSRNGLSGVVIVLDPGHGGRDLGTMNHGIWEHDYVYDVACRLKAKIEKETEARVVLTLIDEETGCAPSKTDKLQANRQGTVQTTPKFLAKKEGEAKIGVNLRWYLSNSVYREERKKGTDPERLIFLSLHADSRHPSLRGVMVYVPGAGYRTGTYGHTTSTYRKYKEVREKPQIRFSKQERLRSEAVSRAFAASLVKAFEAQTLPVQPYQPVRHRIIRGKSKYVPAVLRGNAIPAKVLVELVNLSNPKDAAILASATSRDRLARGLLDSLRLHFGEKPNYGAKK